MGLSTTTQVNGKPVKLRVSFADVFRTGPARTSQKYLERKKFPSQTPAHSTPSTKLGSGAPLAPYNISVAPNNTGPATNDTIPASGMNKTSSNNEIFFTAEQDQKILDMKNENATWNQILQAIGTGNKSAIQARFKALKASGGDAANNKGGTADQPRTNTGITETKKQNSQGQGVRFKMNEGHQTAGANIQAKYGEPSAISGVDKATLDKMILLRQIADKYDANRLLAIASRYFDYTGKRLTLEEVQKSLAEILSSKHSLAATFATDSSRSANPVERSRLSRGEQSSKPKTYKDSSLREYQSRNRATDLSPEVDLSALRTLTPLRQPPQPQEAFSSPPSRVRSHSGAYYAAAWGSPYATPSPPRPSIAEKRANTLDGAFHDISPLSARSSASRASSRGIANLLSITARGPLNKFTRPGGEDEFSFAQSPESSNPLLSSRSERGNWLSDSEGSAKGGRPGDKRESGSVSPGWLGLGEDSPNEDELQTPTVKRFTDRKPLDTTKSYASIPAVNHKSHDSLATIKQDDFSDLVPDFGLLSNSNARMDTDVKVSPRSETATNIGQEPGMKPLPDLPPETAGSDNMKSPYDTGARPPLPNAQSFQRPKKRIICKGKACIIALPLNDERGRTTRLLSPADVAARMQHWKSQGFDTEGFLLNSHGGHEQARDAASQSRSLFPDPNEVQHERISQSFRVRIPNKAEWEAWIRHLKEEKLRALGVSFGDEEPVRKTQSPMSGPMSRSSSHQPNLPISPPVPSSTASSHVLQGFSPAFNLSTNSNSQQGSIASPNSQYSHHRQQPSIAIPPTDKRNASPFGPNFQPGLPAGRFNSPGYFSHGGVSPMGPVNMKNLGEVLSPVSPFQMDERNGSPRPDNLFNQTKQQQSKEFLPALSQPQLQPHIPSKAFGPHADSWRRGPAFNEIIGHSDVEIAHPTPGRHNRNVSEALEREIDGAEDPLEMAIRKQLQNPGDEKPSMNQETPLVDTNPDGLSDIGSPAESKDFEQKGLQIEMDGSALMPKDRQQPHNTGDLQGDLRPADPTTQGHHVKPSVSGLNVQAKEFSFNPTATFTPGNFAFTSNNFNAPAKGFNSSVPKSNSREFSLANSATHPTSFNVEAPAFKPLRQADEKPSTTGFKFGSGLKVDAPVFNPSLPSFNASVPPQPQLKESSPAPRIFGDFSFEGPAKTSRRSKAVPIVHPDDSDNGRQSSDELEEDEEGRLGPSEAYRKRARRVGSDGERLSSLPGSPSTKDEVNTTSPPVETTVLDQSPSLEREANNLPDALDSSFDQESGRSAADTSNPVDVHTNITSQEDPKEKVDSPLIIVLDKANGAPVVGPQNDTKDEEHEVSDLEDNAADVTDIPSSPPSPPPKHVSRSSLSATAQPFEPQTYLSNSSGQWSKSSQMRPQPNENTKPSHRETNGLASSRYAPVEPSSSDSDLEEAMERMLDLQEASHAIKNGSLSETEPPSSDQLSQAVPSSETEAPSKLTETLSSTSALAAIPHEPAEISPSFTEIDAVMKQLNEADSELGIERSDEHLLVLASSPVLQPPAKLRSDAPSPSPQRIQSLRSQHIPQDSTDIDLQSPQFPLGLGIQAPVQKLNKQLDDNEASDWNDMLSSADEGKFFSRTQFFDGHVNSLVGGIMDDRMVPLERSIDAMQKHLGLLVSNRRERINTEVMPSDADDEDDESDNITPYRSRSPPTRRRARSRGEQVKKAVLEALEVREGSKPQETSKLDLSRIYEVLAEMKMLAEPGALQDRAREMRTVIEDVISTHPRLRGNRASHDQEQGVDKLKLQVDGLETMLKLSNERAEDEYQTRKEVDIELSETKRSLTLAEEEAARHREASEEAERSLHAFYAERKDYDDLQITVSELSLKNAALETTLEEYRLSHDQWRSDIDEERAANKELRGTMHSLKKQIYESHDARQGLRVKFERLQDDMANAARDIANDHATWSRREHQLQAQNDQLQFVLDREREQHQSSGDQLKQLLKDHEDIGRLRHSLDQSQNERATLEELVKVLQAESKQHQDNLHNGRIQFEVQLARLQNELESSILDADRAKARQEDLLTDAIETKKQALADATQTREDVLQEQSRFHERALNDLRERHARVLHNSTEDRERAERHLQGKLDLSSEKNEYLEDKVAHLEEKLEVTKAAAKAAADAAASRGVSVPSVVSPPRSSMASMPFAKGTDIPEKISPQALRESIMVLQEQLQNREQSIEQLEQELGKVDKEAPEKLKAKDTEITWLRELLGVRLDDLQDIIVTLAQPDFNREAVKDAAIRLKANLQMEQQVKERAATSSGLSQGISSITNLTQSPSRLPMAAAAAWGNWRKGAKDLPFSSTLSDIASIASQTPSRTNNSPQSFLSGLMTPPATNQRQTPTPSSTRTGPASLPPSARPLRAYGSAPRSLSTRQLEKRPLRDFSGSPTGSREPLEPPEPPQTPPLLRKGSYDQDASETSNFSAYGDDDQSTIDGRD